MRKGPELGMHKAMLLLWVLQLLTVGGFGYEAQKPLRFLGNENIPPIISVHDGKPVGLVVDLARAVAEKSGLSIQVEAMDWPTAQSLVLAGKADALLQMNKNAEREELYDFSTPLLDSRFQIFRKSTRSDILDLASLYGKKVGVEEMGFPAQLLGKYDRINLVMLPSWTAGFTMLSQGEIDAVVVDRWVGEYELSRNKIKGVVIVEPPLATDSSRIAVRKGNQELLDRINQGLAAIERDGTRKRILEKWSSKEVLYVTKDFVQRLVLLGFLVCCVLVMIFAIRMLARMKPAGKSEQKFSHAAAISLRYGLAVLAVVASFGLRETLMVWSGPGLPPFITFYPTVMFVALLAGFGPCLLATASAGFMADFWIFPPIGQLTIGSPADLLGLVVFVCMGLLTGAVAEIYRRSRDKAAAYDRGMALRDKEERLRLATTSAKLGVFEWNVQADKAIWENDRMYEIFGLPPGSEAVNRKRFLQDALHPDDFSRFEREISASMRSGGLFLGSYRIRRINDGELRWIEYYSRFEAGADGKASRLLGVLADITERKLAEEALRDSEKKFSTMFEASPIGISIATFPKGEMQDVNEAWMHITGYSKKEDTLGKTSAELGLKPDPETRSRIIRELGEKGRVRNVEMTAQDRQGNEHILQMNLVRLNVHGQEFLLSTHEDITDRKRAEEALLKATEQSELDRKRLEEILEAIPAAVVLIGAPDYRFSFVNKRAMELYGFDTVGLDLQENVSKVIARREDGSDYPIEEMPVTRSFKLGIEVHNAEMIIQNAKGISFPILASTAPLRDLRGNIASVVVVWEDITDRKKAENALRQSEEQLRAANKELTAANKELESFSYSVSHDLRAPLRSIKGFSDMLLEGYLDTLDKEGVEFLKFITTSADKMSAIIDDLLSLAKLSKESMNCREIELGSIATLVVNELRETEPQRKVEIDITGALPAYADNRLITIALRNLIGNAWKYTGKNPNARIDIGVMAQENETVFFIRDNGAGFDMKHAHRLFQPFQRLHSEHEFPGTGIGLATVAKIIQRHEGKIWAESETGKGATFYFTLGENPSR